MEDFEVVSRVFSAPNFLKLIELAKPHEQFLVADYLIAEAKARIADPLRDLHSELVLVKQRNEFMKNPLQYKKVGSSSSANVDTLKQWWLAVPSASLHWRIGRFSITVQSSKKSCGACRYRKKKCPPQCRFAPIFSLDKMEDFGNVVKVFGAHNFMKLMDLADPLQQFANTLSVHGLAGMAETLSQHLDDLTSEIASINQQNRFHLQRHIIQQEKSLKERRNRSTFARGASSPASVVVPSPLLLQDLNNPPSPLDTVS
ncbi:hypothetical protein MKX01_019243 [Papaver californicum]|nr:hypothetical protein MKX01_019243 [Papaver californicum]